MKIKLLIAAALAVLSLGGSSVASADSYCAQATFVTTVTVCAPLP